LDNDITIPKKQRALVLSGGGALGAYEIGVLKALCKKLEEENKNGNGGEKEDRPLFDIVAGTSIGAMNASILVSNVVKRNKTWSQAVLELEDFWTNEKKTGKEGLASTPDYGKWWWHDEKIEKPASASSEAARRYYSVKEYLKHGTPNVCIHPSAEVDSKFADSDNLWLVYNIQPLQNSIERFADFPIATKFEENQPRLLVFSVDVAAGETVTFDSYGKAKRDEKGNIKKYIKKEIEYEWKTEYGKYIAKEKRYENMIIYDGGIGIQHVIASYTVPEFYKYKEIDGRKFWDGGILSNTPFREVLQAHRDYWINVLEAQDEQNNDDSNNNRDRIPNLEVYIVILHPSKQADVPSDHDGVKDRHNDITYCDRNSYYDEKVADLITDYMDLVNKLKCLAMKHFRSDVEKFLTSMTSTGHNRKYRDLLKGQFELTKVIRIERANDNESISGKVGDFTQDTIKQLITQGENDAYEILKKNGK
jgi:NTE family protein